MICIRDSLLHNIALERSKHLTILQHGGVHMIPGHNPGYSVRCAGENEVAFRQSHILCDVLDEFSDREEHIASVAVLAFLSIDFQAELKILVIVDRASVDIRHATEAVLTFG